jgi:protein arginine N-methyltransferase 1
MKPGGTMFPSAVRLLLAGIHDAEFRDGKIAFWDNVYDFSYAPIKDWALLEAVIDAFPSADLITQMVVLKELNLNTCAADALTFEATFRLVPIQNDTLDAFVVWFDALFQGPQSRVLLSTSPYKETTHWNQTGFYLKEPIAVVKNRPIDGFVRMEPSPADPKESIVTFRWTIDGVERVQTFKLV